MPITTHLPNNTFDILRTSSPPVSRPVQQSSPSIQAPPGPVTPQQTFVLQQRDLAISTGHMTFAGFASAGHHPLRQTYIGEQLEKAFSKHMQDMGNDHVEQCMDSMLRHMHMTREELTAGGGHAVALNMARDSWEQLAPSVASTWVRSETAHTLKDTATKEWNQQVTDYLNHNGRDLFEQHDLEMRRNYANNQRGKFQFLSPTGGAFEVPNTAARSAFTGPMISGMDVVEQDSEAPGPGPDQAGQKLKRSASSSTELDHSAKKKRLEGEDSDSPTAYLRAQLGDDHPFLMLEPDSPENAGDDELMRDILQPSNVHTPLHTATSSSHLDVDFGMDASQELAKWLASSRLNSPGPEDQQP